MWRSPPSIFGAATPIASRAMRALLDDVHFEGHLDDRVSSLSVARRHLLELAKAFAVSPRLLILDEPTAPLSQDSVDLLFTAVRKLAADGNGRRLHHAPPRRGSGDRRSCHRPARRQAPRDRRGRGHLGRRPPRHDRRADARSDLPAQAHPVSTSEAPLLRVEGLSGHGFDNISFTARKGEIVGVAGVVGNGQRALLRALAGLDRATGTVNVGEKDLSRRALLASAAYMPADRLTEGLMLDLNVRENAALTALDRLTVGPFVSRRQRARRRRTRALRAGGQGSVARGAGLVSLRRKPAEGRDVARDALRAGDPRRGRADAGRRRRCACRDLPHPARGRRPAECPSSSPPATPSSSRGSATG